MATELRLDFVCPKTKDDFVPSAEGLFCTECQKPVLDFTGKKQPEIVRALRKHAEMPCVWIPTDALRQPTAAMRPRWWGVLPKSAALLGFLLLLGDIKAVFAQTGPASAGNAHAPSTPQGYQVVHFTGRITDPDGKPLEGADVVFTFLSETVGRGRTEADGSYSVYVENYGGIREVDVSVELYGYHMRKFTDVSVSKPNPGFSTELTKIPDPGPSSVVTMIAGGIGYTQFNYFYSIVPWYSTLHPYQGVEKNPFGHPPVRFDDETLEYLDQKLSYRAIITDKHGNAIPGARVLMRFEGNAPREGFANADGLVSMNMQLDKPALNAHIVISAPGYYNKSIPYYAFDNEDLPEYKLLKRPVEMPDEPAETALPVTENAQRQTESETEAARSLSIGVYPNPANETVSIRLPGTEKTSSIQLNEEYGRVVAHKSSYGESSVTIDTQSFVPGTYVVQVTYNGAIYREKLLIVR